MVVVAAEASLGTLRTGNRGRVVEVAEPGATGERLLELGLTPGTEVRVVRRGAFGETVVIEVRGATLTLRREQARNVLVDELA